MQTLEVASPEGEGLEEGWTLVVQGICWTWDPTQLYGNYTKPFGEIQIMQIPSHSPLFGLVI